jgi:hypothetical protein
MLSPVKALRIRVVIGLLAAAAVLAACSGTTDGSGSGGSGSPTGRSSPDFPDPASQSQGGPTAPDTSTPLDSGSPPSDSSPPDSSTEPPVHPAPATPLKTVTVHAAGGVTYVVKLWADVRNTTCFDHAYGQPVITFLTEHPCRGLERFLGTTTVGGRRVGFAESVTGFNGTAEDPYVYAGRFHQLEEKDGTGSINDLLREGYRLPSGPKSVPSPDAFSCVSQDIGVTVWDIWYLDGSTPDNAKPLVQLSYDLFLQF